MTAHVWRKSEIEPRKNDQIHTSEKKEWWLNDKHVTVWEGMGKFGIHISMMEKAKDNYIKKDDWMESTKEEGQHWMTCME